MESKQARQHDCRELSYPNAKYSRQNCQHFVENYKILSTWGWTVSTQARMPVLERRGSLHLLEGRHIDKGAFVIYAAVLYFHILCMKGKKPSCHDRSHK